MLQMKSYVAIDLGRQHGSLQVIASTRVSFTLLIRYTGNASGPLIITTDPEHSIQDESLTDLALVFAKLDHDIIFVVQNMYANMVTGRLNRDDSDVRNEAQEALPEIARIFQDFDAAHAVSASFHQHYLEETRILKYWGRGASFLRQLYDTDTNGVGAGPWALSVINTIEERALLLSPVLHRLVRTGTLTSPTRSAIRNRWLRIDDLLDYRDQKTGSTRNLAKW